MDDEYPQCPICFDIYGIDNKHIRAPKVLKCGDSLCKECLEKIIKRDNENFFLCPLCRGKIEKNKNIDDYIDNKQIITLVNSYFNLPKIEVENKEGKKKGPITYRIISLGNSNVGKTCIFQRILNDEYDQLTIPTVAQKISKPYYIKYKEQKYKIFFFDTAGLERNFNSMPNNYLIQSDGVLFVYDITDRSSFEDLSKWIDKYKKQKKEIIGLVIGNKCDIDKERKVDYEEAKSFSDNNDLGYYEVSAKLDKNVKKVIASLLKEIIDYNADYENLSSTTSDEIFQLNPEKLKKESFCSRFCKKLNPKNWLPSCY